MVNGAVIITITAFKIKTLEERLITSNRWTNGKIWYENVKVRIVYVRLITKGDEWFFASAASGMIA